MSAPAGPRGLNRDLAYPPGLVGGGQFWLQTHLPGGVVGAEEARPSVGYGGFAEVMHAPFWPSNPSGLPRRDRFHKQKIDDEWWYLKVRGESNWRQAPHSLGADMSSLQTKSFRAENLEYNGRITYPFKKEKFDEEYQKVKDDAEYGKEMEERYKALFGKLRAAPRNTCFHLDHVHTSTLKKDPRSREDAVAPWRGGGRDEGPGGASEGHNSTRRAALRALAARQQVLRSPRRKREAGVQRAEDATFWELLPSGADKTVDPPWATDFNNSDFVPPLSKAAVKTLGKRPRG